MTRARLRKAAPWAGLVLLWLVVSVVVGLLGFANDSERVTIGAHAAQVSPTFDGTPRSISARSCRACGCRPTCRWGSASTSTSRRPTPDNLTDLLNRDALIASQPDGEIARIRQVVQEMAIDNAVAGAGSGLLVAVVVGDRLGDARQAPSPRAVRAAPLLGTPGPAPRDRGAASRC